MTDTDNTWPCEAYGPAGTEVGALCFLADVGTRVCTSPDECARVMAAERRRIFDVIQTKAAAEGDDDGPFTYLAGEFTSPDQLLGGPGTTGETETGGDA